MYLGNHRTGIRFTFVAVIAAGLIAGCSGDSPEPQTQFDPNAIVDLTDESGDISLLAAVRGGRI